MRLYMSIRHYTSVYGFCFLYTVYRVRSRVDEASKLYVHLVHHYRKKKKDELIKEDFKQRRKREQDTCLTKQEEAVKRNEDSNAAFDAWAEKKDDKIRSQGKLYTYTDDHKTKVHPTAWCPARSMTYSYPRHGTQMMPTRTQSRGSLRHSGRMSKSRESPDVSARSEVSSALSTSTCDSRSMSPRPSGQTNTSTGKHKTIQVCCQTLEYWCTCDDT